MKLTVIDYLYHINKEISKIPNKKIFKYIIENYEKEDVYKEHKSSFPIIAIVKDTETKETNFYLYIGKKFICILTIDVIQKLYESF